MMLPEAAFHPTLKSLDNNSCEYILVTWNLSHIPRLASFSPLSTTMISLGGEVWAVRACKHLRRSVGLSRVGITTETSRSNSYHTLRRFFNLQIMVVRCSRFSANWKV